MRLTRAIITAVVSLGISHGALATTVDFEELVGNEIYDSPVTSGGLTFENDGASFDDGFVVFGLGGSSNGTNTFAPNYFGSVTTVSAAGGAVFTLDSFDFSDVFDFADDPIQVDFTFDTVGGFLTRTYFADFDFGMQTQSVGISGISSFSFVTSGSFFGEDTIQTDNWVYTLGGTVPGAPEPSIWVLLIAGFGMVGVSLRRRRIGGLAYAA
jgi:hypothetical protein